MRTSCNNMTHVPSLKHIRTMHSIATNAGPGRERKETHRRRQERQRLALRRQVRTHRQRFDREPCVRWYRSQ